MPQTLSVILVTAFILSALSPALVTSGTSQGPTVEWRLKLPAVKGLGEPTAPIITDVDGDGKAEIVLTSGNGLYVLRSSGVTMWKYSINANFTGVAVTDLKGNGEKELVGVTDTGTVYCLSRGGSELWSYETKGSIHFMPTIADVNADGALEIVVLTSSGDLSILGSSGSLLYSPHADNSVSVPLSMAPMYQGEIRPVFYTATADKVEAFDYSMTSPWTGAWPLPDPPTAGMAVGNLDNDTKTDIVVPTAGRISVFYGNHAHTPWNATFTSQSSVLAPVLADINQDGIPEIIVGNADGDIQQYSSTGTAGWLTHIEGGLAGLSAVRAQDPFIIAMSTTGNLVQIDATGHQTWTKALGIVSDQPVIVADIDGDSEAELIAVGTSGEVVLLNTHQVLKAGWAMAGHDLMNSRDLDATSIGQTPWSPILSTSGQSDLPALLADVNGDGKDEIFYMYDSGYSMALLQGNGHLIANSSTSDPCFMAPIAADINGDGGKEIIFGTYHNIQVRSNQLALIWDHPMVNVTSLAAADINGDGKYEVFGANDTGHLLALRSLDGVQLWSADVGHSVVALTAADLSSDGIMDIIVTDNTGIMSVLNATNGHLRWQSKVLSGFPAPPTIGDFNGDGKLDVAVSSFGGEVLAYSGNGTELWERIAPLEPLGLVALDGNATGQDLGVVMYGTNDILFLDGNTGSTLSYAKTGAVDYTIPTSIAAAYMGTEGKIAVLTEKPDLNTYLGELRWAYRNDATQRTLWLPQGVANLDMGDLNGDGSLEMLVNNYGPPIIYNLGFGPGPTVPWSMAGHDPERTYDPFAKGGRIYSDLTLDTQNITFAPMVLNGNVTVNVTFTYRNQGPVATGPFNITLYKNSAPLTTFKAPPMAPFSDNTMTYKWAVGSDNSTFTIELDSGKVVNELREDNNKASRPIFKNLRPIAVAGPDVRTDPDKPVVFDGSASRDLDGDIVKYSWDFDDGTNATGVVTSHAFKESGYYNVYLTVTDEYGATSRDNRTIWVNHAPLITNWSPKTGPTINEGEKLDLWVITSDTDGDKVTVTWFLDGTQVAQGQAWSYWADYSSQGHHKVMAVASDGSLSSNMTWDLTVIPSTRLIQDTTPPSPVTIPEGQSQDFEVVLTQVAVGSVVTWFLDGNQILDGTKVMGLYATQGTQGHHVLKVQVRDDNEWDFYEWNVTIGPKQDIPTFRWAYPTGLLVETTYLTPFYFSVSAVGGTYQWYINGIAQVAQNGPSFRFDTWGNGSYNISVVVSSDKVSVSRNWTLTVNYPPNATIDASDLLVTPGKKITFNSDKSKAYKPGDSIVSYKWDFGDGSSETGPVVNHVFKKAGGYQVNVTVTDTRGLTSTASVTIVVEPKEQASTPGFEGPLIFAAIGIAFVAGLRRRNR